MQVLDEYELGHDVEMEQIRPYLRDAFPWHQPNQPHHHLSTPDAWWSHVESILARAFQGVGFDRYRAKELAQLAHRQFIDPKGYKLYDDTIPTLKRLSSHGWNHVILSNHVPELADIIEGLSLSSYISCCITSASIGYEKPHPEAFRIALTKAGNPKIVWMIGDNPVADVGGAEALGLPAILVRNKASEGVKYYARDLLEAASIVEAVSDSR